MKLLILSICKNEAESVGKLLDLMPKKMKGISEVERWIISDGSTDDTAAIAKKHGAKVIDDGQSKRLAVRFREALDLAFRRQADIMVNIDGDLQFDPRDIPKLVEKVVNDEADFVAADRFTNPKTGESRRPENMPAGKYYGNRLGAWIVGRLSSKKFVDVTCGFRAYNRKAMFALNTDGTYTYTQESFQVLAMKRMRIQSIPVKVVYHKGRKSRVVRSLTQYMAVSAISILRSYRDFAPLRFFGWLGFLPFILGAASLSVFVGHWLATGSFTPFKFLGFAGVYFVSLSVGIWALGLVADMLSRMLNNQEKILEQIKRHRYDDDRHE